VPRRHTHESASADMITAGLSPLVPYPGTNTPWLCQCLTCGSEVSPRHHGIISGQGGCKKCGYETAKKKLRTDEVEAVQKMRSANLEPLQPYPGAHKPWKSACLECGSEASPMLAMISSGQGGCKKCGYKKSSQTRTYDQSRAFEIMRSAGLEPLEPYEGSQVPLRCLHLECGREVFPRLNGITSGQGGCGYCAGNLVDVQEATKVMESAGYKPLEAYTTAREPWRSLHLDCGREVFPTYGQIRNGDGGCKYCAKVYVDPSDAERVMANAGLTVLVPYPGSGERWQCRHNECGRVVYPRYSSIHRGQSGCVYCARRAIVPSEAEAVMRNAGLEPLEAFPGSSSPWICLHTCGRQTKSSYRSVQEGRTPCLECWQDIRKSKKKNAADLAFKLAKEPKQKKKSGISAPIDWASKEYAAIEELRQVGLEPLVPFPGVKVPWPSTHSCGKQVSPALGNIRSGAKPCKFCAGKAVDPMDAVSLMESKGLTPLVQYPGASVPWACHCNKCNQMVSPTYANLKSGSGGCKFCAQPGIDYGAPGIVYLMVHTDFYAAKIGITSSITKVDRIETHVKHGWQLLVRWDVETALRAEEIEQEVLSWWRDELHAPYALTKAEMKQGGHTETVSFLHVDVDDVINFVESLMTLQNEF
jgi:recombinational DNA repair protein (RecF pathway)